MEAQFIYMRHYTLGVLEHGTYDCVLLFLPLTAVFVFNQNGGKSIIYVGPLNEFVLTPFSNQFLLEKCHSTLD